ncbi:hypothetical protein Cgig2_012144 [Carnegiea gigantea]|uniref:Transposase n=1 Tax=Carnegiea gigantea TaxID=171969 RepID=A0A9Q1QQD5_9CARY|nr:hypothetical protein Cgig2_012144 [Carnegiea gigantea]
MADCDWRVHCRRLLDGVTWQVKSLKGTHTCPKLQHNRRAFCSWVASELLIFFKENPTMDYLTMQNSIVERHGIAVPTHVRQRAKELLKEWVEGSIGNLMQDCLSAKLHLLFLTACNAYTKHAYKQTMDAIKRESKKAYEWLVDEPIEHWARFTFDSEVKCPDNTTNFVESFNGKIKKYRRKPMFTMLEAVRRKFVQTITNRAKLANQWKGKILKGIDKPSYKEKRGKRKVGRPRKEAPPSKKLKTIGQPSSSQSASQTSTTMKRKLRKRALREIAVICEQ